MMKQRIVVEHFPNLKIREYHLSVRVSEDPIQSFEGSLRKSSLRYLEGLTEDGREVVRAAFDVPGVEQVTVKPHSFSITIGAAFRWEDFTAEPHTFEEGLDAETLEEALIGIFKGLWPGGELAEVEVLFPEGSLEDEKPDWLSRVLSFVGITPLKT